MNVRRVKQERQQPLLDQQRQPLRRRGHNRGHSKGEPSKEWRVLRQQQRQQHDPHRVQERQHPPRDRLAIKILPPGVDKILPPDAGCRTINRRRDPPPVAVAGERFDRHLCPYPVVTN